MHIAPNSTQLAGWLVRFRHFDADSSGIIRPECRIYVGDVGFASVATVRR